MKTFTERWVNGKLVRGEEGTAAAPMQSKGDVFLQTVYGRETAPDEPQRGYHANPVDNGPKTRKRLFERADAVNNSDITPGAL